MQLKFGSSNFIHCTFVERMFPEESFVSFFKELVLQPIAALFTTSEG